MGICVRWPACLKPNIKPTETTGAIFNSASLKQDQINHNNQSEAPSIVMRFRLKTHIFYVFSPIFHTTTPENADENGTKVETFENASFLVWTDENGEF